MTPETMRAIESAKTLPIQAAQRPTVYVGTLITGDVHVGILYQANVLGIGDEAELAVTSLFTEPPRIVWAAEVAAQ